MLTCMPMPMFFFFCGNRIWAESSLRQPPNNMIRKHGWKRTQISSGNEHPSFDPWTVKNTIVIHGQSLHTLWSQKCVCVCVTHYFTDFLAIFLPLKSDKSVVKMFVYLFICRVFCFLMWKFVLQKLRRRYVHNALWLHCSDHLDTPNIVQICRLVVKSAPPQKKTE